MENKVQINNFIKQKHYNSFVLFVSDKSLTKLCQSMQMYPLTLQSQNVIFFISIRYLLDQSRAPCFRIIQKVQNIFLIRVIQNYFLITFIFLVGVSLEYFFHFDYLSIIDTMLKDFKLSLGHNLLLCSHFSAPVGQGKN